MVTKLLLTAQEAAEFLGYDSDAQFRRAVDDGVFPKAYDTRRPMRWSRPQIEAALQPKGIRPQDDKPNEWDERLGLQ